MLSLLMMGHNLELERKIIEIKNTFHYTILLL